MTPKMPGDPIDPLSYRSHSLEKQTTVTGSTTSRMCAVNAWDDGAKLQWLKDRLTGHAQTTFKRLPQATQDPGSIEEAV